ncbi:MAG TPA: M23 family metallopeptidase [Acidimicrobiia bacterium]|nr:M23 family metallopeptidase [Acidimicrobiia bacterium]
MSALVAGLALSWCLFTPPVDGPVIRPFAPVGAYGGHWGIDLAVPEGTPVRPIAPGVVSFAGMVAGRASVTVDHGGAVRSSYSYLSSLLTTAGQRVDRSTLVGVTGVDRGIPALHLSVRVGGIYVDPTRVCSRLTPAEGLALVA